MAETAKQAAPKGMEGVEAIMKSEPGQMMDVARGAVNYVAPDAPYVLEGSESMMMQENPFPKERIEAEDMGDFNPDLIEEHYEDGVDEKKKRKEPTFSDEDIKEHLEKDKSIKTFLANNLKAAQKAVKVFSATKGQGGGGTTEKDEY
tara:strand:+ start:185 stop:625 length:441 start_codon:yes stop_codon:yes gene_type:complete